jgi:site-specific DNA-methyltransferase (adenine-specific)
MQDGPFLPSNNQREVGHVGGDSSVNYLYYGDNLDILRRYIKDESVDLIYLDPPFNSNASYNVLFAERNGTHSKAQIKAFEDTWRWDEVAAKAYADTVEAGGKVADALLAFRTLLGGSDMLAYLAMMAPRLVELRRVLKATGSIYLHCDPTASHYLKLTMDAVFGPNNFRNEITWKRRHGFSSAVHDSVRFGNCTDTILFYGKSAQAAFVPQYNRGSKDYREYVERSFTHIDEHGRRYQATSLTNPAYRPNLIYEYKGYKPPANGWMITMGKMEQWDREGRIHFPESKGGRLRRKSYADELKGMPIQNLWDDIEQLSAHGAERLGYPTQKPEALLDRIIQASSKEGDLVLDPFCGCGTSVAVAERLKRSWVGIDITHLAIGLIKTRLHDAFAGKAEFKTIGEPTTVADAKTLAAEDPYQFQWWSLGLVGARPVEGKKGSDKGIDGRLYFHDEDPTRTKQIIFSVKAGHVQSSYVRDLGGVLEREKAQIGVLVSLQEPTREMRKEAASGGFYDSPWDGKHPRVQLLTVGELLAGKRVDYPHAEGINVTFKKAPRAKGKKAEQIPMALEGVESEPEE